MQSPHVVGESWETCLLEPAGVDTSCLICYDVMVAPTTACSRGHTLCFECLQSYLESRRKLADELSDDSVVTCPGGCGEIVDDANVKPAEAKAAEIGALPAKCRHEQLGCKWRGNFRQLVDPHLAVDCLYETVPCPYKALGCNVSVRRGELEAHLASASLRHIELTGRSIGQLQRTVAGLESTVSSLDEQLEISKLRLGGNVPQLLALEQIGSATLQTNVQKFLGMYKLDETTRINDLPLWVHMEDDELCLAGNRETSRWHAQPRAEAGLNQGFIYAARADHGQIYSPVSLTSDTQWLAYTGNVDTGEHAWQPGQVRCVAWDLAQTSLRRAVSSCVVLDGELPVEAHGAVRDYLGVYWRRDDDLMGGRHVYIHSSRPTQMMWFARHGSPSYTGW